MRKFDARFQLFEPVIEVGESNSSPSKCDSLGYRDIKSQVSEMVDAGERLQFYRQNGFLPGQYGMYDEIDGQETYDGDIIEPYMDQLTWSEQWKKRFAKMKEWFESHKQKPDETKPDEKKPDEKKPDEKKPDEGVIA